MTWWAVALGALAGAPLRFLADRALNRGRHHGVPWGTVLVNMAGCTALGCLGALFAHGHLGLTGYDLLGVGLCGSFTTFSTFVWENLALAEQGRLRQAGANMGLSLAGGLALAGAAFALTTAAL